MSKKHKQAEKLRNKAEDIRMQINGFERSAGPDQWSKRQQEISDLEAAAKALDKEEENEHE